MRSWVPLLLVLCVASVHSSKYDVIEEEEFDAQRSSDEWTDVITWDESEKVVETSQVEVTTPSPITDEKKWRDDGKCGYDNTLSNGHSAECDPKGPNPCCSDVSGGRCGNSTDDCKCSGCVDYRNLPGTCPQHKPFPYLGGSYCCKYNRESYNSTEGSSCDGSIIGLDSTCCKDDRSDRCPGGENICQRIPGKELVPPIGYRWNITWGSNAIYNEIYDIKMTETGVKVFSVSCSWRCKPKKDGSLVLTRDLWMPEMEGWGYGWLKYHLHPNISYKLFFFMKKEGDELKLLMKSRRNKGGLIGTGTLIDIDECADPTLNKCGDEEVCENTPGSYKCS